MASKYVIATIWFLILVAGMAGFAWTQWPSDDPAPSPYDNHSAVTYLDPSIYREGNKRRLIHAASQTPEFGGVFLTKRGTVVNIYLAEDENDPEKWEQTRQSLEELLDPRSGLSLNVIRADYTITTLSEWYDLMQSEGIWDQDGVHMIDLHEGINQLYIGVVSEWEVAGVYTFLEGIGIPRGAATVAAVEPPTPASG